MFLFIVLFKKKRILFISKDENTKGTKKIVELWSIDNLRCQNLFALPNKSLSSLFSLEQVSFLEIINK